MYKLIAVAILGLAYIFMIFVFCVKLRSTARSLSKEVEEYIKNMNDRECETNDKNYNEV